MAIQYVISTAYQVTAPPRVETLDVLFPLRGEVDLDDAMDAAT